MDQSARTAKRSYRRRRLERGFSVADWMSTKNRQQIKDFNTKLRALDIVGNGFIRCAWCGDTRIEVLHLDHINGDGHRHRRQMGKGGKGAGMRAYRDIIRHSEKARQIYQLLCSNCHQLKGAYQITLREYAELEWLYYQRASEIPPGPERSRYEHQCYDEE